MNYDSKYVQKIESRLSLTEYILLMIKSEMNRPPIKPTAYTWHKVRHYISQYDAALMEIDRGLIELRNSEED